MNRMRAVPVLSFALSLLTAAAFGDEAPRRDIQAMIDELRSYIARAEAARAADPRFLEDLRDALGRYESPWPAVLLEDDFGDGDFTRNPTWTVRSGDYVIDRKFGLRRRAAPTPSPAVAVIGQRPRRDLVWGPPTDPNWAGESDAERKVGASGPVVASTEPAEISTAVALGNAFSLRLELRAIAAAGRFGFGPYQGRDRASGYRLGYLPGRRPRLELSAVSRRGVRAIATRDAALNLDDGVAHRLQWDRRPDGLMTVSVDGREILRATDRGFTDAFDGVTLVARGDYAVRSILIRGKR